MKRFLTFIFTFGIAVIAAAFLMAYLDGPKPAPVRPEPEFGVDFWFTVWTLLKYVIYVAVVVLGGSGLAWVAARARNAWTTQTFYAEDGLFPAVVLNTGGLRAVVAGRTQRTILQLNNAALAVQHVTVDRSGNMIAAGDMPWSMENQLEIALAAKRAQLASSMNSGGGLFGKNGVRNRAQAALAMGEPTYSVSGRRERPRIVETPETEPLYLGAPPQASTALKSTQETSLAIGYNTVDNGVYTWNVRKHPHARIHGESQSGKTTMTQTAIVNMLIAGWHVIICDRRRFKDYHMFEGYAQLVDTSDTGVLLGTLRSLVAMHQERDIAVSQAGTGNISGLTRFKRYGVIIDEFGTQMMYAQRENTYEAITAELFTLAAEAASSGVHLWIADQKPVARLWDDHVRANIGLVLTGYMPRGSGQSAGDYHAYQLGEYEFRVNGDTTVRTWPVKENWSTYVAMMPQNDGEYIDVEAVPVASPQVQVSAAESGDEITDLQRAALQWLDNHAARVGRSNVRSKHLENAFAGRMDRSYAWKIFDRWRKGDLPAS